MKIHSTTSDEHRDLFSSEIMKNRRNDIAIYLAQGMLANPNCEPKKVTDAAIFMAEEFIIKMMGSSRMTTKEEATKAQEELAKEHNEANKDKFNLRGR